MFEIDVEVPNGLTEPVDIADAVRWSIGQLNLTISIERSVARSPDSRHWHIKKFGRTGTVEVTMIPNLERLWVCYHDNRVGDGWVQDVAPQLADQIGNRLREIGLIQSATRPKFP
jgi:hypothetical protein